MFFIFRKLLRACCASFIFVCSLLPANADDVTSIPQIMVDLIRKGANLDAASPASYVRGRHVLRLAKPVIAPNDFYHDEEFSRTLAAFDNVPAVKANEVSAGSKSVSEAFSGLKDDLVLSTTDQSAASTPSLDQARKLLFKPNGLATDEYATYLRYESDHKRILDKLKVETDPGSQQQQRLALAQLEREWELLGRRSAIAIAVSQYESARKQSDPVRIQTWVSSIKPFPVSDALSQALTSSQWLRFSYSNTSSVPISATTATGAVVKLGKAQRISFDAAIVWLDRSYLTNPFLTDRGWKTKSGRVVSSGVDGATDDLVPEVISGLLVAKNVELQLASEFPDTVMDLLKSKQNLSVDAFLLTDEPKISFGFQARQLTLSGPVVLGTIVDQLRKIPDPAPTRQWPN
ncbi:hypothetical protein IVB03_21940 [Bradyrhizobium sp. 168]|uniref:hypothetical protein n=1 Tax=unclassified Bradyrhizobium TaxID=2631580 RepID=UPI001FF79E27|nr:MULTISPECIES: hypothetical protein [unclassified Bradyrhizobium]MCK1582159.1 hypothetical protein [Bradyrhizobium sp. 168]UPK11624.1 hypothetical protein IVA93_36765 [Bradyrhizobium sp. 155]UPK19528.1 hypothetical protein IVA73_37010 [Bradyrhizobium sp. 131]